MPWNAILNKGSLLYILYTKIKRGTATAVTTITTNKNLLHATLIWNLFCVSKQYECIIWLPIRLHHHQIKWQLCNSKHSNTIMWFNSDYLFWVGIFIFKNTDSIKFDSLYNPNAIYCKQSSIFHNITQFSCISQYTWANSNALYCCCYCCAMWTN